MTQVRPDAVRALDGFWWWPWRRRVSAQSAGRPTFTGQQNAPGVYADWHQLLAFEFAARRLRWPPQNASPGSLLAGRHRSRVRGRGLDFIELRQYLPGDDTRAIDWRASARTGQAHVRIYAEERDRPTWLVVDQRISMFFARRGFLHSVVAAEAAAIWGWRALSGGDRVGGIVFGDTSFDVVPPRRGRRSMLQLLSRVVERNHELRADIPVSAAPEQLDSALAELVHHAPKGAVLVVVSDFDGLGVDTRKRLFDLSRHNDLVLIPVWDDPDTVAVGVRLVVSDGNLQVLVNQSDRRVTERLAAVAEDRRQRLHQLRDELCCSVLPLTCTEPTLMQLARGLDSAPTGSRQITARDSGALG